MKYFYNSLFYMAIPVILLRLLWKSRYDFSYCKRIGERFGFVQREQKETIWVHAVSVGEMIAAKPLIKQIQMAFPDHAIILTSMTLTAAEQATPLFGNSVRHYFVPYDLPGAARRFLTRIRPKVAVIMETEIWPNLICECAARKVPLLLANARLSARSAAGYRRFSEFTANVLSKISVIAVQTTVEAERFQALGARKESIIVTGSVKFDQSVPASVHAKADVFKSLWGRGRPVWVAASTHEGEEDIIFDAHQCIRERVPNALLVVVPRHPERFSKVAALSRKYGFCTVLRSDNQSVGSEVAVVIGDSMGELLSYYAASDLAFVGGSLVPVGGHNLLEPAALGVATITGEHVFNFQEITEMLAKAGALVNVCDAKQLATQVIAWFEDSALRTQVGEYGRHVVENNRGSVQKHFDVLTALMVN